VVEDKVQDAADGGKEPSAPSTISDTSIVSAIDLATTVAGITTSTTTPIEISTNTIIESSRVALEIHPIARIFPEMRAAEFEGHVADIKANGQRDPIMLYEGMILDGVHRYRGCLRLGLSPKVKEFTGNAREALAYAVSKNLMRRHLSEAQRAIVAAKIASFTHGGDRSKSSIDDLVTQQQAADLLNVSKTSVERASIVVRGGTAEDVAAVTRGKASLSATARRIRKTREKTSKPQRKRRTPKPAPSRSSSHATTPSETASGDMKKVCDKFTAAVHEILTSAEEIRQRTDELAAADLERVDQATGQVGRALAALRRAVHDAKIAAGK
jgi:ParB-like chromosome segregation protein Spo0J